MPRRKRPHSKPIPIRAESPLTQFLKYVKGHRVYPAQGARERARRVAQALKRASKETGAFE